MPLLQFLVTVNAMVGIMIQMKVMELVVLLVILHELRVPKGRPKIE